MPSRIPLLSRVAPLLALLCAALAAPPAAHAREPIDLLPADSLLCWHGRPLPDTSPPGNEEPSTLQTLLEIGARVTGQSLDAGTQLAVRGTELFGLTIRYPHAFGLIDVQAKPVETDPKARRVDRLRCALVVENRGHTEPFLKIIQKVVNEQTNQAAATLVSKKAGAWGYQELRDHRLPDWAVIAWGHIDEFFVLTIGEDVWPKVAEVAAGRAPAITADEWYKSARESRAAKALIELFVAAEPIQERLDPLIGGRASEFFRTWDAASLQQAHWAFGLEGRALFAEAHFRINGKTVTRLYADPDNRDPQWLSLVPPDARYAIYQFPMSRFLDRFFRGLVGIQGEKPRANIERIWAETQAKHDFDVQRDLLAHLGDHVILHNDPPHPLHLPLAVTALIEIRDEPALVRKTINALCGAFQEALENANAEGRGPPWMLQHDDDGVWYFQYGPVAGIAWTVTDRFIVTSWSPRALREYLAKAGPALQRRPR